MVSLNTTDKEFLANLRYGAIASGANALMIDKIDSLLDAPTEDEIEARIDEAQERGNDEGREAQHEICLNAIMDLFTVKKNPLAFTQAQVDAIRAAFDKVEPQS